MTNKKDTQKRVFLRTFGCQKDKPNFKARSKISRGKSRSTFSSQKFGMTSKRPSVYIRTFGCQMNFRDSEFVTGLLLEKGFTRADRAEDADIVLFNTCSVRSHAEERAIHNAWDVKSIKDKKPYMILGIIGCMAQARREDLLESLPFLDFICGPDDESNIPELLQNLIKERAQVAAIHNVGRVRKEHFPRYRDNAIKAHVSISRGCDNYCSYCIVPFVRGKERSRKPADIIREVSDLGRRGFKEVTLLGQNVNSYRGFDNKKDNFVRLLERINAIRGIERIRFITSHPEDASSALFRAMRDLDKVCEHLHLPIQSGSDRILKLMNRRYSSSLFLRLADLYRKLVPGGALTTDIIVGFPSETARDFKKTEALMKRVEFDSAFIFKYSPRPPAKSSRLKDTVPDKIKGERNRALLDLQLAISEKKNTALIGTSQEVLFEGFARKRNVLTGHSLSRSAGDVLTGRTRSNKIAVCEGCRSDLGKSVSVTIEDATCHTLIGKRQ